MDKRVERGIITAGIGWILSGVSSLLLYLYLSGKDICSCPNIPSNSSIQVAQSICHCPSASPGLLAIASLALVSGIWMIIARKRIERLRAKLLARRLRYESK